MGSRRCLRKEWGGGEGRREGGGGALARKAFCIRDVEITEERVTLSKERASNLGEPFSNLGKKKLKETHRGTWYLDRPGGCKDGTGGGYDHGVCKPLVLQE